MRTRDARAACTYFAKYKIRRKVELLALRKAQEVVAGFVKSVLISLVQAQAAIEHGKDFVWHPVKERAYHANLI